MATIFLHPSGNYLIRVGNLCGEEGVGLHAPIIKVNVLLHEIMLKEYFSIGEQFQFY